jgi:hypothetical protein
MVAPFAEPVAAAGATEPEPLLLCGLGMAPARLQEVIRARQLPVRLVADVEQAEVVLSVRGQLGRDPELRRRAQAADAGRTSSGPPSPPSASSPAERP